MAVSITNPDDIPGIVKVPYKTMEECLIAKEEMTFNLKFKQFIVKAECINES